MQDKMLAKKYFLEMVGASIKGAPIPVCPNEVDTALIYKLSVRNAVQGILYLATQEGKIALSSENNEKLRKSYMAILAREASQCEEINYIRETFTRENIKFMFLKGINLKCLYPVPEMRFMVDMDILVNEQDVDKGRALILARGFTQEMNNGKDIVLIKKPFLTIELHKMLFVEDYFMHDYFSSVWDRTVKIDKFEHMMTTDDLYVYTLAHLAEHYLEAGSCFRPLMDLFLLEKKHSKGLDFDYINKQFKKIGIEKFAQNIRQLYKCIFGGEKYTENLLLMENYIVFGAPINNAGEVSRVAQKKKSKSQRFLHSLLPGLKHMKLRYPVLKTLPVLLPVFWIVRFFDFLFNKSDRIKYKKQLIIDVDNESISIMKDIFEKSGL